MNQSLQRPRRPLGVRPGAGSPCLALTVVLVFLAFGGCASSSRDEGCEIGDAIGASEALEGEFTLRLTRPAATSRVVSVEGNLRLLPQRAESRSVSGADGKPVPGADMPFYGSADLDLGALGAAAPGELDAAVPRAPGVGVYTLQGAGGAPTTLLRLGTEANRRDRIRFDGAYTVLEVEGIGRDGFSGGWRSGDGSGGEVHGSFCAHRW